MAQDFFTTTGYLERSREEGEISASQEDYLEMIYRICIAEGKRVKAGELAKRLNVAAPSATKAISKLVGAGLVVSEKYGSVFLTEKGRCKGAYLLKRHNVLNEFFCILHSDAELAHAEAELAEHFMSEQTIYKLEYLNKMLKKFETELEAMPQTVKL